MGKYKSGYPKYFRVKCYKGIFVRLQTISVCVKKYQHGVVEGWPVAGRRHGRGVVERRMGRLVKAEEAVNLGHCPHYPRWRHTHPFFSIVSGAPPFSA